MISFFQNNYIKTSKYTLLTFLPLNLFEQFQRLANFYFLCLMVLQMIPVISSLTWITTSIPLVGVLALTAVKDAYDDYVSQHFSFFKTNYSINFEWETIDSSLFCLSWVVYFRPKTMRSWLAHLKTLMFVCIFHLRVW